MAFALQLTVPKSTPILTPVSDYVWMSVCVVSRVELTFPDGCAGLVGARFKYGTRQLWPANPDAWYRGNGQTVIFEPNTRFDEEPVQLHLEAYSLDDTFPHTLYAVIGVDFEGLTVGNVLSALAAQLGGGLVPGR